MADQDFKKVGHFKDISEFRQYLATLNVSLPLDDQVLSAAQGSPLAQPLDVGSPAHPFVVGNRWCIHPMEGWDGTPDGLPTEHTLRRWEHFGASGAKFLWGGEAFAVQSDGRANPNQIGIIDNDYARAEKGLMALRDRCLNAHRSAVGSTDDLFIGLQLTHSGRFCKPYDKTKLQPRIAYHHPILDKKFGISPDDTQIVLTDDELKRIIDNYVNAAKLAHKLGYHFVDVKHCHGYLGHELLSAFTRPGPYGGSLENRTRYAREIIQGIQSECPGLHIGVRLSVFDYPPFKPGPQKAADGARGQLGAGVPEEFQQYLPYLYGFGCNPNNPLEMDLAEPIEFIRMLTGMGVRLINLSCGSPYYNPHIQRPAMFPPSDGYQPPEDPLVGCSRQIDATAQVKQAVPDAVIIGSGYTYLQDYLPHVGQAVVRQGMADLVGIGRLVLSYWDLIKDTLTGTPLQHRRICRTFSDCTTAPRNGIISGCYPLDPHYKDAPEHVELKTKKMELRKRLTVAKS